MLRIVTRSDGTRWTVSRRRYFMKDAVFGDWGEGVAEKVRAERKDTRAATASLARTRSILMPRSWWNMPARYSQ
jgi:hypothetical protein